MFLLHCSEFMWLLYLPISEELMIPCLVFGRKNKNSNDKLRSYPIILLSFPWDGAEVSDVTHYVFNIT